MQNDRNMANRRIAVGVILFGTLLFIVQLGFIFTAPSAYLDAVETVNGKVYLLFIAALLSVISGIMLFSYFHEPSALRYVRAIGRSIAGFSAGVIGVSIFGWPRLSTVSTDRESQIKFNFLFDEPSGVSWPLLLVIFSGLIACAIIYAILDHFGTDVNV